MSASVSILDRALRILHLEDSPQDRELIQQLLESEGFAVEIIPASTRDEFMEALHHRTFDIILSDKALPAFDGLEALSLAKNVHPEVPFVFVTGSMGEEAAIESIKDGATDYVLKDRLSRLVPALERAIREADQSQKNRRATAALRESEERFQLIARASKDVAWDWNIAESTFWESPAIRLFGYGSGDIHSATEPLLDHVHADEQQRVLFRLHRSLHSREQFWTDEYPYLRRDGSVAQVFARGYIIRDAKGVAVRMVGAIMDITDRKKSAP